MLHRKTTPKPTIRIRGFQPPDISVSNAVGSTVIRPTEKVVVRLPSIPKAPPLNIVLQNSEAPMTIEEVINNILLPSMKELETWWHNRETEIQTGIQLPA